MPRYSPERKHAVLAKLLPPHSQPVTLVSRSEGIRKKHKGSSLAFATSCGDRREAIYLYILMIGIERGGWKPSVLCERFNYRCHAWVKR